MKKTIEITVGQKPEGEVDLSKCAPGSFARPPEEEVQGHSPYRGLFECYACYSTFYAWADTDYYVYVRCPAYGHLNRI